MIVCHSKGSEVSNGENQRDFLWGGKPLGNKVCLVKWGIVHRTNNLGGLGLRRLETLNKAPLEILNIVFRKML